MEVARRSTRVAALVLLEGWTHLVAARAFVGDRMFGNLPPAEVEEIQQKANATLARFPPQAWQDFWQSMQRLDAYA